MRKCALTTAEAARKFSSSGLLAEAFSITVADPSVRKARATTTKRRRTTRDTPAATARNTAGDAMIRYRCSHNPGWNMFSTNTTPIVSTSHAVRKSAVRSPRRRRALRFVTPRKAATGQPPVAILDTNARIPMPWPRDSA